MLTVNVDIVSEVLKGYMTKHYI